MAVTPARLTPLRLLQDPHSAKTRKRCLTQPQAETELQFLLSEQQSSGLCQGHCKPQGQMVSLPAFLPEMIFISLWSKITSSSDFRVIYFHWRCKLPIALFQTKKGVKYLAIEFDSTRSQHEEISCVVLDPWQNPPLNSEMNFVAGSDCCYRPNQHLKSKHNLKLRKLRSDNCGLGSCLVVTKSKASLSKTEC